MSIRFYVCLLLLAGLCGCSHPTKLARQIADADRVVATNQNDNLGLSVTGEDVQELVRTIASAKKHRGPPLELAFGFRLEFYKGTNLLSSANVGSFGVQFWDGQAHYTPQSNALKILAEQLERKRQNSFFNEAIR